MRILAPLRLSLAVGLGVGLSLSGSASAQVNRCVDPASARVQYTDGACPRGQNSQQIEAAKTPEELEQERIRTTQAIALEEERRQARAREQALQAELAAQERINQRLEASQQRAMSESDYAQSSACKHARHAVERATPDHGRFTRESRQALETAQDTADRNCLSPQAYANVLAQRASQRPPVVVVQQPYYGAYPPRPRPPFPHRPPFGYHPSPPPAPLPPYYPYPRPDYPGAESGSWGIDIQIGGRKGR